jgi:hypothetical protein
LSKKLTPEQRDKRNALKRKYYRENPNDKAQKYRWAANHRDKAYMSSRGCQLKARYGITSADYDRMVEEQGNRCAICKEFETAKKNGKVMRLHVDHDHATGKVRGLLCADCNHFVGWVEMVRNNPERVAAVDKYLWQSLEAK